MGFDQPNMDKHWDLQKLGLKKKNIDATRKDLRFLTQKMKIDVPKCW